MQVVKLVVFGAFGALGLLRGIELVLTGNTSGALIPGALGSVFALLFVQELKKRRNATKA